MDERVIIAIAYIAACVILAIFAPQYVLAFIAATEPIITYYFIKKELEKLSGAPFSDIASEILETIEYMCIIALVLVIFISIYLWVIIPAWG